MQTTGFNNSFVLALVMASAGAEGAKEPFFEGLGSYTRKGSTDSPEAQRYFNQGLNFLFSFDHGAAIRAFQAAESPDPTCAMAYCGVALACGPHANVPQVPPPAAELAEFGRRWLNGNVTTDLTEEERCYLYLILSCYLSLSCAQ
jgi:hypothetical protein